MKKIVLSIMVVGSLLATSCKEVKDGAKDLKDSTVEAADNAADATKDGATKLVDGAKGVAADAVDATKEGAEKLVEGAENAANATIDATKEGANKLVDGAKEAVASALDGVSIPAFANEEVTKHLESYATYAKEYIAAKGDVMKNAKLAKQGVELAKKGKELLGSLDAESATKFKSVMSAIQSKMAPAK